MNIFNINYLNLKKLKVFRNKALFLILPLAILVSAMIVITSQSKNLTAAIDKSVFGTIEEQSRLIELSKNVAFGLAGPPSRGGGGGSFSVSSLGGSGDSTYYESDVEAILSIDGVETAALNSTVPISNAKVNNLFEDDFNISSLTGIDSDLAGLYTEKDFTYKEGQAIPIILNGNTFINEYIDWGGKDEIVMEFNATPGSGPRMINMNDSSPRKTKAISYEKSEIIGKEFTIEFGGLEALQQFVESFTSNGITFTKLTEEELQAKVDARKTEISKYWDYEKISTPIKYTFVVAGVTESQSNINTYVPEEFAKKLMTDFVQNQLDARNTTEIPLSVLDTTFTGINFDGTEIKSSVSMFGGRVMTFSAGGPGGVVANSDNNQPESSQYAIPGLVISTERTEDTSSFFGSGGGEVLGVYTANDVYEKASKSSSTILIKTSSIYDRAKVVDALNDGGYAYQDLFKSDVFNELKNTLNTLSLVLSIAFIGVSSLIVVFTVSKFVSESRKEIGILRAMGATKATIRNMFLLQGILYSLIGFTFGSILGYLFLQLTAGPVHQWFVNVIGKTIKESFNTVVNVEQGAFSGLHIQSYLTYSAILFLIIIIASLIPAIRAARLSPVQAIKGE